MSHVPSSSVVLGFFSISHLGDAMCATTLPRKIFQYLHKMVYVVHHPSTVAVYANNPYVAGFKNEGSITLLDKMVGLGHNIQKLEQGFNLPVDPFPKPELYFSDEELKWAWEERSKWPKNKPICLLSTSAITATVCGSYNKLYWEGIVQVLNEYFTIVYPAITSLKHYRLQASVTKEMIELWENHLFLDSVIQYYDLPLRQYLLLFTVADYHVGPTTGGAQVAAALEIPSLLIFNGHTEKKKVLFPCADQGITSESFLYPHDTFITNEELFPNIFEASKFAKIIENFVKEFPFQGQSPISWQIAG